MARLETPRSQGRGQPAADHALIEVLLKRLHTMERLVRAIEDELGDEMLDDEQKLQNIGERMAGVMDGR